MIDFKTYLESEEKQNVKDMIAKLPKGHQELLRGYKFKFQGKNTLKGDNENIGVIYQDKITVASPWRYGREYTTLHEIAHLVFEYKMTPKLKKQWSELIKKTKTDQINKVKKADKNPSALKQNDEELFAMAYAQTYADNPVTKFDHPEWIQFIKDLPS